MTANDILDELAALGTEQNRKIYARHGVGGDQYGVSYANLNKLKKTIKTDHEAALKLWASGNHDARILAMMIADPGQAEASLIDAWAEDMDNYVISDAVSGFVSKTAFARQKMEQWTGTDDEWIGQAGWSILARLALNDRALPDDFFHPYLGIIATDIHHARNRVRYAMNNALIAIGSRSDALAQRAVSVARQIGPVEVDHGETGCKTPEAASYIKKARARQREKAVKK